MRLLATTLLVAGLLTGCGINGLGTDGKLASGCEWTEYIMISKADKLTDGTADQILAHNVTRKRLCD